MKRESSRARSGAVSLISSVVAQSKSKRKHSDAEDRKRASTFRSGMQAALLRARLAAQGDQAERFFSSAKRLALFESNRFSRQPVGYDYLEQLHEPVALPLDREIIWLSHRINSASVEICRFLNDKRDIESLMVIGRFAGALELLNGHITREGSSIWSVSLKIGLLQLVFGVDAQKEYVGTIRSSYKRAMLPYLANTYSQRAEDEISIGYYLESARRRLERVKSSDISAYLRFRIDEKFPLGNAGVATILRMEQNHHEIDVFETFVRAIQCLSIRQAGGAVRRSMKEAVQRLSAVGDFRLAKVGSLLDGDGALEGIRSVNAGTVDMVLRGDLKSAFSMAATTYKANPGSFPAIVVGAIARSHSAHAGRLRRKMCGERVSSHRFFSQLVDSFVPVMRRRDARAESESDDNAWSAKKIGHVLGGLDFFQALRAFTDAEEANDFSSFGACIRNAALLTNEISILDAFGPAAVPLRYISGDDDFALREFLMHFENGCGEPAPIAPEGRGVRQDVCAYADACRSLKLGEIDGVEVAVRAALSSPSRVLASHAASVALEAYAEAGRIGLAAELITSEHVNFGTSVDALPISAVFDGVGWLELEPHASAVSLSIALFIYSQMESVDTTHSYRCFALETFLHAQGVERPSELRSQLMSCDSERFAFFLGKVCEWSLLDMLPPITSTRDVLEERRDICALLLQIGGVAGSEGYRQELLAVTKELVVQQGLQTIDGSRVHVDLDALRVSLRRDLSEGYSRYVSLVRQGIGTSEDFDTVLRNISKNEAHAKYLLSMPQNEADDLLFEMIRHVRERFLFDIPHGLDSYLSKRIRHGSVVGYLRGPAEKEGIISPQNFDGTYKNNERWSGLIASSANRAEIEAAFQAFARNFDGYLIRLKDVRLHVRSEQQPLGVFDAPLGPPLFHLIRSVTSRESSIQAFVDTLLASLWGLLNPSLVAARDLLLKDTARSLADMFDALRLQIAQLMPYAHDRVELEMAVGRASAGVQAAVQTVAAWFNPIEGDDCDYSLEDVVEIALASVRSIAVSFKPVVEVREKPVHHIARGVMLLIVDALFIAFHNIARWCGSDNPSVMVDVVSDEENEIIRIRVVNSVAPSECSKLASDDVRKLKERIFTSEGTEMARREGGSGLFKLASITAQASSGRLDFGFSSESEFFVEFDLSLPSLGESYEDIAR